MRSILPETIFNRIETENERGKMALKKNSYEKLRDIISEHIDDSCDFSMISGPVEAFLDRLSKDEFVFVLDNIGIIPESIEHDSTEEKLYSKVSDIVLSKAFRYLGMRSTAVFSSCTMWA